MTQRYRFVLSPTFADQFSLFIHQAADYEIISNFSSKERLENNKMNTQKTNESLKKSFHYCTKETRKGYKF